VTPSNDKGAPSDVATHCDQEGVKGGSNSRKQCHQGTTTMNIHDDGPNWEASGFGVRRISINAYNGKSPVRPPTYHFKRFLEEDCPNHAYPIRHKLKDCDMMRSFLTSGTLTWGVELDQEQDMRDTMLFPEETPS
jgi:hypothetical protein